MKAQEGHGHTHYEWQTWIINRSFVEMFLKFLPCWQMFHLLEMGSRQNGWFWFSNAQTPWKIVFNVHNFNHKSKLQTSPRGSRILNEWESSTQSVPNDNRLLQCYQTAKLLLLIRDGNGADDFDFENASRMINFWNEFESLFFPNA